MVGSSIVAPAQPAPFSFHAATSAVLVVDMQNDFGSPGGLFARAGVDISAIQQVIGPTKDVLRAARRAGMKVIYLKMGFQPDLSDLGGSEAPNRTRHLLFGVGEETTAPDGSPSRLLVRGTWNTEILPELNPEPVDNVVYKSRFSGFYETELDTILKRAGIKDLIVTGCTTSVCVESTVRDAMFRDYRCLLLSDCMAEPIGAGFARSNHEASLLVMQTLFAWVTSSAEFVRAMDAQQVGTGGEGSSTVAA
jgi:ureidoacrylate peracid hydrolase